MSDALRSQHFSTYNTIIYMHIHLHIQLKPSCISSIVMLYTKSGNSLELTKIT